MAAAAGLPSPVAGVDEVGRGPLAGPLVAAAVILDPASVPQGLADSKALSPARRDHLAAEIRQVALVGTAVIDAAEIDALGLGPANEAAMLRALDALPRSPAAVLADGRALPRGCALPGRAIVGGDATCAAIAAASIVAKVMRDEIMQTLDLVHPGYGWAANKGYATAAHRDALARLGVTPQHRRCFAPVAALC
ncbi:MAG: ribonuclease HII [Pseudomonadota bacterium]